MANIAITNYCNLRCKYCFADDMIHEPKKFISIENFRKILSFIAKTPSTNIGIIGGEPTLHPNFLNILSEADDYCKQTHGRVALFSNGIELGKYLPAITENISILINCNAPIYLGKENIKKMNNLFDKFKTLSWFESKVRIGCNIHPDLKDYTYIWQIVERYNIKIIRVSVVSPAGCYTNFRSDKEAYYKMMKDYFIKFCKNAEEHNCKLSIDCNHIPSCYFTNKEKKLLEKVSDVAALDFCRPVVDITPDFRATACFGVYEPINLNSFSTLNEVEQYLLIKKTIPKYNANCYGRCKGCKEYDLTRCQGGCLGFARM